MFDEHCDDRSPEPLRNVDRALLEEIAANSQRRIEDTGDECPITLGHTPSKGEREQPPIVGFARNFRVEQFGKINPRAAIVADFRFPKSMRDELRKYPRRSVEIWPKDKIIDPIALLGAETPRRDLGLMQYQRGQDVERVRYSMDGYDEDLSAGDTEMAFDMKEITDSVLAALMETPIFKKLSALLPEEAAEPEHADIANTLKEDEPPAPEKMSREVSPHEAVRYQREIGELSAKLEETMRVVAEQKAIAEKYAREKVEAQRRQSLNELKSQGYELDVDAAVAKYSKLADADFNGYIEDIRKYHRRAPVGVKLPYQRVEESGAPPAATLSQDEVDKIVRYSQVHKVSFEEAKAKYQAGR